MEHKKIIRRLSLGLAIVFLLTAFTPIIGFAQEDPHNLNMDLAQPSDAMIANLKLNKSVVMTGTEVLGRLISETPLDYGFAGYITPSGSVVEAEIHQDEDSGLYMYSILPEELGNWKLAYLRLSESGIETSYQGDGFYGAFQTVDNLENYYGTEAPFVDDKNFTEDLSIRRADLYNALGQVRYYDSMGESLPVQVYITGQGHELYSEVFNDGITITASELPIEGIPVGAYTADFVIGERTLTKNFTLVEDWADASYVYLSSLPLIEDETPVEETVEVSLSQVALSNAGTALRLAGDNRFGTAVSLSKNTFTAADSAILVNAYKFPDALAAVSLASALNGPILFTSDGQLSSHTESELKRLGVKTVYAVGGTSMISNNVLNQLKNQGITVNRIAGNSRFTTAMDLARKLGGIRQYDKAILVYAYNFPDALSAGAYSGLMKYPILYTETQEVGSYTLATMKDMGVKEVIIVGGTGSISANVETQLQRHAFTPTRVAGKDRYETSYKFAMKYYPNSQTITIANGADFPDALAGGPIAAYHKAPILLSSGNTLYGGIQSILDEGSTLKALLFGGNKSLAENIITNVEKIVLSNYQKLQAVEPTKPVVTPEPVETKPSTGGDVKKPTDTSATKPAVPKAPVLHIDPRVPTADNPIRIMLDAGHGWGYNKGSVEGYYEGIAMYWYAHILRNELVKYGFDVGLTRTDLDSEEAYVKRNNLTSTNGISLEERGNMAAGYDLLLSLHTNALSWTTPNYQTARGTEIFDSVTSPRKDLATDLCQMISDHFGHNNRGVKYKFLDDGSGRNWYGVLRNSKATHSMLVEHGFHTNKEDTTLLMDREFKIEMAEKTAALLADYYGMPAN